MPTTTTLNDDGSTTYRLITGRTFSIARHPDVNPKDIPGLVVNTALETLTSLADKTHSVTTDPTLSVVGRQRALDEIQRASITTVARLHGQLVEFEKMLDRREQDHLAVPPLRSNDVGLVLGEFEIRAWWNRVGADIKSSVMAKAATDDQCQRVLVAVMRSPIPVASEPELEAVRSAWTALRDSAEPDVRERIEGERRAADWALQSLGLIASIVNHLVLTYGSRDKGGVLELLLQHEDERVQRGSYIYGYTPGEIAHGRRLLAARQW